MADETAQTNDWLNEGFLPASASKRAYRTLERMIVTLELPPSGFVTEGTLIDRLGLGRTPVREAIQRLAWEGLLEVRPRAGITVAPLHASDWLRIIDARRGVEIVLARAAARLITNELVERFQAAAVAMHDAVLAADVIAFLEADKSLDEVMADASENPFAARVAAPLQTQSRRFWFRFQRTTGLAESASNHVSLISAIINRDEETAGIEADKLMSLLRAHAQTAAMR